MPTIIHTPRLFLEADLNQGLVVTLTEDQAHFVNHVMRMSAGSLLRLFNGRNGEWLGAIIKSGKRATDIEIREQLQTQKSIPDLWLCCAPIKKAHFDYMIEKATELGVSVIQPILTSRTQVREVNIERCRTLAIEAAEQSERLNIPEIKKPMALKEFITRAPKDLTFLICAERGAALPMHEAFAPLASKNSVKAALVTGPEGGFSDEELDIMKAAPHATFIHLGPRILRADTAAIAAVSCWQAFCGDWDKEARS